MQARVKMVEALEPYRPKPSFILNLVWELTPTAELKTQLRARPDEGVSTGHTLTLWPRGRGEVGYDHPYPAWPAAVLESFVETHTGQGVLETALAVAAWRDREQAMLAPGVALAEEWCAADPEERWNLPTGAELSALIDALEAAAPVELLLRATP